MFDSLEEVAAAELQTWKQLGADQQVWKLLDTAFWADHGDVVADVIGPFVHSCWKARREHMAEGNTAERRGAEGSDAVAM